MKQLIAAALLFCFIDSLTAQNVGINVANPDVNLTVLKDIRLDAEGANNGTIVNSLRFGTNPSGEYIFSKRTTGGNQYGLDFVTGSFNRLSIANNGDVLIGSSQSGNLLINGAAVIDNNSQNNGGLNNGLRFGSLSSGEGISSNRNSGTNQYGLDFYTLGSVRLSISLDGIVKVDNKPVVTFLGAGKQQMASYLVPISANSLAPGAQVSVTNSYLYNIIYGAWGGGFSISSGDCSKVAITTEIIYTALGHYDVKMYATNISNSIISFNGTWNLMVMGGY